MIPIAGRNDSGVVVGADETLKYRSGKLRRDGKPGFNTPSGKIEFASSILAKFGYETMPDFREPPMSPYSTPEIARDYPLILVSGTRSVEFYSTLGIEVPRLRKRRPWPVLEMSPETALELAVSEGEWVIIEAPTTDKSVRRQVALVEGMLKRIKCQMSNDKCQMKVIATGGYAELIGKYASGIDIIDPDLTLKGLSLLCRKS